MNEFGKGWKVLVAAFLGVMCGASPIPFNILGLLFAPLFELRSMGLGGKIRMP